MAWTVTHEDLFKKINREMDAYAQSMWRRSGNEVYDRANEIAAMHLCYNQLMGNLSSYSAEELRHHLPLFLRGRELFMPYRHVLGALSGGHVADVVVQMGGGALRAALEVGALEYDAGHRHSLPSIIKK